MQYRRMICLLLSLLLFCSLLSPALGETDNMLSLVSSAAAGDSELRVSLAAPLRDVRASVFSGEENVLEDILWEEQLLTFQLNRSLRVGETLSLLVTGMDDAGDALELTLDVVVGSVFHQKLKALSHKAEEFLTIWNDHWLPAADRGEIPLNILWRQLPFALWPDEAPDIQVQAEEEQSLIYLDEPLPEDWRIAVGEGIPVVYTPCEYDEKYNAWLGPDAFDSVYLIHDMTNRSVRVAIEYNQSNRFLPSYPVVEWERENGEILEAFNCYGWGTARSYEGGMMAVVENGYVIYAEYDSAGALISYTNPEIDCAFDPAGNLLEGTLPEGYADPVLVR